MANEFPECEFLGCDIAPLKPTTILPKNCSFELANVLEGIPKPDRWFDYVHQRFLIGAIPADKWKQHIRECTRICASGGWVEIVETTGRIVDGGPACHKYNTWFADGFKLRGIDVKMGQNLDEWMHEAGLINVTKQTFTVPVGPWGGQAGELFAENYRLGNIALQPLFTNALGVPKEEYEKTTALMLEEFKSHQTYITVYVYLGQKQK
jgi:ubiquinone/menaquinone biosynthesis C-methylase UbiE